MSAEKEISGVEIYKSLNKEDRELVTAYAALLLFSELERQPDKKNRSTSWKTITFNTYVNLSLTVKLTQEKPLTREETLRMIKEESLTRIKDSLESLIKIEINDKHKNKQSKKSDPKDIFFVKERKFIKELSKALGEEITTEWLDNKLAETLREMGFSEFYNLPEVTPPNMVLEDTDSRSCRAGRNGPPYSCPY